MAILKKKTYNDGIDLPEDVLEYISTHISDNIRELEGALISLLAQSTLNKKEITLDLTKEMIDKLIKSTKGRSPSIISRKWCVTITTSDWNCCSQRPGKGRLFKQDRLPCFFQSRLPNHHWQPLVRKLEVKIMPLCSMHAKLSIT